MTVGVSSTHTWHVIIGGSSHKIHKSVTLSSNATLSVSLPLLSSSSSSSSSKTPFPDNLTGSITIPTHHEPLWQPLRWPLLLPWPQKVTLTNPISLSLSLSLSQTHTCICNFVYVLLCLNSHVGFIHLYLISLHVNLNFAPLLCISLTGTKAHTFMCLCM